MKNVFFMKKWNVTWKNQVKSRFLENLWKIDIQYTIIFHQALWLEKPWKIHLFKKSFEKFGLDFHGICEKYPKWSQNGDLGVWIPGIGSKFRSESNGDGSGPQNPDFWVDKLDFNSRSTAPGGNYVLGINGSKARRRKNTLWLKSCP